MKNRLTTVVFIAAILVLGFFALNNYIYNEKQANGMDINYNWQTETVEDYNITFQYPESLKTTYVDAIDWPPEIQVLDEEFNCLQAGLEGDRTGITLEKKVNDRNYCITTVIEGAAGSIYRQYAYASPFNEGTLILTFSLRFPQCGNFPETEKEQCEDEYNNFNLDILIDYISQTVESI